MRRLKDVLNRLLDDLLLVTLVENGCAKKVPLYIQPNKNPKV